MKIKHLLFACIGALALHACSSDEEVLNTPNEVVGKEVSASVNLVVPVGCHTIRVDYPTASGIESTTTTIAPMAKVVAGRDVSSITNAIVDIVSPVDTYVNVYDENGTPLVQNYPVLATTNRVMVAPGRVVLPETAVKEYVTNDGPFTFYHSSGVAMFDDSWPVNVDTVDSDFSDVVIDYDIEAKTVDMTLAPNQSWRECIKVVMHLRTVGGMFPDKAGVMLEGLDTKYIDSYECRLTLGNWNENIPANSLTSSVDISGEHPVVLLENIGWLTTAAAKSATYPNSKTGAEQVMNVSGGDAGLYYNVSPDYINVGGDLFTLTVIFRGKDRSSMSTADGDEMITNFINSVMDTESQNFFIRTNVPFSEYQGQYEIHMKGYEPTPFYANTYSTASAVGVEKDNSTTYSSANNLVWGIKVPVLTRHAWEMVSIYSAYPEYLSWVQSNGASNSEWYKHPEADKISIWW